MVYVKSDPRAEPPWGHSEPGMRGYRQDQVAKQNVPYWCCNRHETVATLAADAGVPPERDCPRCGQPAGLDRDNPPQPPGPERYHTHLQYVKERRSEEDADQILREAWARARQGGFNR